MTNEPLSPYRLNQSLIKGLALLAEMNRSPHASGTISDMARTTGQHRTTVKRLLETLKQVGYVEHDVATNIYKLSFRVQQLSYGYRDTMRVTEVAWPHMRELSRQIIWPCSLVAPEGDEMVVRVSTRPYSQLSFHPGMPGRRLSMLTTSAGRAYLAFASAAARATILDMLKTRKDSESLLAHDSRFIKALLEQTRACGYASNFGEWNEEPKFGGYAMPIRKPNGEVMVSLNVIFLSTALKNEATRKPILQALADAVRRIEADYAQEAV